MSRWQPPYPAKTISRPTLIARERPKPKRWVAYCIWPGCKSVDRVTREIPVCTIHALIIHHAYDLAHNTDLMKRLAEVNRREQRVNEREAALHEGKVAKQRERLAERPGLVYYILVGAHIKIGYTTNMYSRFQAYPPDSTVLGIEPGTKATEKERHRHFEAHRALGREWFKDVEEIRAHIAENCTPWSPLSLPAAGPSGPRRAQIRLSYRGTRPGRAIA